MPPTSSFVGYFAGLPVRHGMTMGELARLFNAENKIGADLTVIPMQDWHRGDWFDSTDLPWVNPSPNMRSLNAAMLYPGLCLLEYSKNYSVGRGTDAPFEQIGADFIGGRELAAYLNQRQIPGVRVYPTSFTPTESNFKGVRIEGVRFEITNRELLDATRAGAGTGRRRSRSSIPGRSISTAEQAADRQRRRDPPPPGGRRPARHPTELPGRHGGVCETPRKVSDLPLKFLSRR